MQVGLCCFCSGYFICSSYRCSTSHPRSCPQRPSTSSSVPLQLQQPPPQLSLRCDLFTLHAEQLVTKFVSSTVSEPLPQHQRSCYSSIADSHRMDAGLAASTARQPLPMHHCRSLLSLQSHLRCHSHRVLPHGSYWCRSLHCCHPIPRPRSTYPCMYATRATHAHDT